MSEYHEIKIYSIPKKEKIKSIYIHDDFWSYLAENHPKLSDVMDMIPVFYSRNVDFIYIDEVELNDLYKLNNTEAPEKGICLWGINYINSLSFGELLEITNKIITAANQDLDRFLETYDDDDFTKEKTINNLEELSTTIKEISSSKEDYIIGWFGI